MYSLISGTQGVHYSLHIPKEAGQEGGHKEGHLSIRGNGMVVEGRWRKGTGWERELGEDSRDLRSGVRRYKGITIRMNRNMQLRGG